MSRRTVALLAVLLAALLSPVVVQADWAPAALKATWAVLLVFFLPGYALGELLSPRAPAGGLARALLAVGLSLASTALGGLALQFSPLGIQTASWVVWLSGLTLFAGSLALVRPRPARDAAGTGMTVGLPDFALLALAGSLAVLAVGVSYAGAVRFASPGATQLWLVQPQGQGPNAVVVGVWNREGETSTYTLQVLAGNRVVRQWPAIELEAGEQWEVAFTLPAEVSAAQSVEALLYIADSNGVYRRAILRPGARASSPVSPASQGLASTYRAIDPVRR
ncbi:MAG: DUF1616 domain-containing protein [Chloroflexota bacterium]